MTEKDQTAQGFAQKYLRRICQPKYWWLHLLLFGISLALAFYTADAWWGVIALAIAQYVVLVASGLYAWIGWIMLRRSDQIPLLPSVAFITACFAFGLTLTIIATPSPLRPYWWLGVIWPFVGFPTLFVFFKLLRLVANTRARVLRAFSGSRGT